MFRDLWNGRIASARESALKLEAELKKIDRTVAQFLDRIVDAETPTVITAYERRIRALEEQKAALRDRGANCGRPLGDVDASFRTAVAFFANPYKV